MHSTRFSRWMMLLLRRSLSHSFCLDLRAGKAGGVFVNKIHGDSIARICRIPSYKISLKWRESILIFNAPGCQKKREPKSFLTNLGGKSFSGKSISLSHYVRPSPIAIDLHPASTIDPDPTIRSSIIIILMIILSRLLWSNESNKEQNNCSVFTSAAHH